jgi:hypothetical protein
VQQPVQQDDGGVLRDRRGAFVTESASHCRRTPQGDRAADGGHARSRAEGAKRRGRDEDWCDKISDASRCTAPRTPTAGRTGSSTDRRGRSSSAAQRGSSSTTQFDYPFVDDAGQVSRSASAITVIAPLDARATPFHHLSDPQDVLRDYGVSRHDAPPQAARTGVAATRADQCVYRETAYAQGRMTRLRRVCLLVSARGRGRRGSMAADGAQRAIRTWRPQCILSLVTLVGHTGCPDGGQARLSPVPRSTGLKQDVAPVARCGAFAASLGSTSCDVVEVFGPGRVESACEGASALRTDVAQDVLACWDSLSRVQRCERSRLSRCVAERVATVPHSEEAENWCAAVRAPCAATSEIAAQCGAIATVISPEQRSRVRDCLAHLGLNRCQLIGLLSCLESKH